MRITFVARREALEVDLPESAWKHKQSDFCIARTNSSQPDLQQVFVKRFRDTEPDAHPLLLGSAVRPLRNAPSLLHCESQDGFHYYVYTLLVGYKDLSFYLHSGGDYSRILSPSSARVLLAQMTQTLADINQRGYFHPDVCWGNIMARFRRDQIPSFALIDLDSCLSLKTRQLPSGVKCDQTWWSLYLHSGLRDPVYLNPTMILGIGLVLCRLLGEPPSGRNGSRAREVLLGRHEDQRALFEACDRGDNGKFIDTFSPAQSQAEQISGILSAWGQILSSMRAGRATPWTDIQQILDSLIAIQVHSNKRSMTGAKRGAEVAKPGIATTRSASRNETIGAEIASSLKTMIANAPSGATIRLAAGTYEVEHTLVIRKRLTLVGAGIDATIIVGYADNCLLACETDESVTLRDLTIRRSGHRCGDILRCGKGTLEVVRCRLAGAKKKNEALGNGLLAHTQGHVSVVQCVLEENDNDGIAVTETAHASVEACTFDRNGSGIAFYDNASGTVRHNTVEDCREYGIYVGKQASPFLEENACYRNARAGIAVVEQAGPTLAGNTCNTNSRSGISISSSSVVVVRENSCAENGQSGISISGQAQAILARNTCQTNALSGIAYFDHATGEARDNSSANNQKCGISVNSQSQPELISNVCRQNGGGTDTRRQCLRRK